MYMKTNVGAVIVALLLGVFMENLDHTIMATAIPTIVSDLSGMEIFSWVFSVYLLTSTIFIPVFGKLADQYGKKPFLLIGFATFVLASLLSANAETMGQLILYRSLQGMGAAPLMPIAFSMIFDLVKPEKQGHMQGLFAIVSGFSMIAGPIVGAYLTDNYGWQWIFFINIPLGVIATILILLFYKEQKVSKKASVDYAGTVLLVLAITPFMLGLVMGGKEFAWFSWQIIGLFAASLIFSYLFIRIEKTAKEPIISLQLFNRKVVSSTSISFLQGIVLIGVMTYIPFFIQGIWGGTATQVGNFITGMIIALMAGAAMGSHLMAKMSARALIVLSSILMAGSSFAFVQLEAASTSMYLLLSLLVMGLGMGPLMPLTTLLAQNAVAKEHTTSVTSLVSFYRNIGMAVGSSMLAIIVNSSLNSSMDTVAKDFANISPEIVARVGDPNLLLDGKLQAGIPQELINLMKTGLSIGISHVFIACLTVVALMMIFSLLAGKEKLVTQSNGQKKFGFH